MPCVVPDQGTRSHSAPITRAGRSTDPAARHARAGLALRMLVTNVGLPFDDPGMSGPDDRAEEVASNPAIASACARLLRRHPGGGVGNRGKGGGGVTTLDQNRGGGQGRGSLHSLQRPEHRSSICFWGDPLRAPRSLTPWRFRTMVFLSFGRGADYRGQAGKHSGRPPPRSWKELPQGARPSWKAQLRRVTMPSQAHSRFTKSHTAPGHSATRL